MVDGTKRKDLIAACEGRKMTCSDRNACDVEPAGSGWLLATDRLHERGAVDMCKTALIFGLHTLQCLFGAETCCTQ